MGSKLSNCKVISTIDDQGLNSDPMIIRLYSQLGKGCKNDFLQNQGAWTNNERRQYCCCYMHQNAIKGFLNFDDALPTSW